ncbi:MAG: hypothetical protein SPK55_05665 [Succinivibrio sp.]|nr:hypothetical protein [Succinivibrio sp.]
MKLSDFNNKYRMGDSLLVKVENLPKIKQVILFIVLRLAEQDNYDERTMPEFKNVKFVFSNVDKLVYEERKLYFETIYEAVMLEDDSVDFHCATEYCEDFDVIIKAKDVAVEDLPEDFLTIKTIRLSKTKFAEYLRKVMSANALLCRATTRAQRITTPGN